MDADSVLRASALSCSAVGPPWARMMLEDERTTVLGKTSLHVLSDGVHLFRVLDYFEDRVAA